MIRWICGVKPGVFDPGARLVNPAFVTFSSSFGADNSDGLDMLSAVPQLHASKWPVRRKYHPLKDGGGQERLG